MNKIGGQFTFFLSREQMEASPVYQSLVFSTVGDLFANAKHVNGVRFVDKYNEKRGEANVKLELWVRFREADSELLKSFSGELVAFIDSYKLAVPKLEFKDI